MNFDYSHKSRCKDTTKIAHMQVFYNFFGHSRVLLYIFCRQ